MIGVMDSGLGGISTLRELKKILPNEEIIYYGDCKNAPYGIKTRDEIFNLTKNICDFFESKNANAIVIACNTASIASKDELRKKYNIPIFALEPATKPAIKDLKENEKMLVFATNFTINSKFYKNRLNENLNFYNKNYLKNNIISIAIPEFVILVEESFKKNYSNNEIKQKVFEILDNHLKFDLKIVSKIVLGCTHFPFLIKYIREYFLSKNHIKIEFYDGNLGISKNVKKYIDNEFQLKNKNNLKISSKEKIKEKEISRNLQQIKFINSINGEEYIMKRMFENDL